MSLQRRKRGRWHFANKIKFVLEGTKSVGTKRTQRRLRVAEDPFFHIKSRPLITQKGGGALQIKYNASSEDRKIPSLGVALRNQKLHTGPSTDITQWFIFTTQHKNYIGPSPIHSDITTDSSSSNIMRSNSSMTSWTVMSNISSARLRRYASNLDPAINDGSHQSP